MSFDEDLFVFEMANNHQGSVDHGKKIIEMCSELTMKFKLPNAAIKFQLRHLDTFIRPDLKGSDAPYIKRFESTALKGEEFAELKEYAVSKGLKTVATIFDEKSIELFTKVDFDYAKIASCSIDDYPLLESLSLLDKPTILSTGGAELTIINRAVNSLKKSSDELAILHCVGIYPTNDEDLCLKQIEVLSKFFPEYTVGFSTHENPDFILPIGQSLALGAKIFEKHVAEETEEYPKNAYSADRHQLETWLATYSLTKSILNNDNAHFQQVRRKESASLSKLKRGVFQDNTGKDYYAFPKEEGGRDTSTIYLENKSLEERSFIQLFEKATMILREAGLSPSLGQNVTFSFHQGLEKFDERGATYFKIFEDDLFLKKWIILGGGQRLPLHFHNDRVELFKVLSGTCEVTTETEQGTSDVKRFFTGQHFSIPKKMKHLFLAVDDLVLEEVVLKETTQLGESIYCDTSIPREGKRKASFDLWHGFLRLESTF